MILKLLSYSLIIEAIALVAVSFPQTFKSLHSKQGVIGGWLMGTAFLYAIGSGLGL